MKYSRITITGLGLLAVYRVHMGSNTMDFIRLELDWL